MALTNCHECKASVSTKAVACLSCGAPVKRAVIAPAPVPAAKASKPFGVIKMIFLGGLALIVVTCSYNVQRGLEKVQAAKPNGVSAPRATPTLRDEMLVKLTPEIGEFRTLVVTGTIRNTANVAVRDPTIRCAVSGNSGTDLAELRKVVFERIEPGKTLTLNEFKVGYLPDQASGGRCALESIQPL